MITNQILTNQSKPASGQGPTNPRRRTLVGGAFAALLLSTGRVMADGRGWGRDALNDPFILLLKGVYQPVPAASGQSNLGLNPNTVNLDDGSYSRTKIYPVWGIRGSTDQDKAIGNFYVQFTGNLCAYDLPEGAMAMSFNSSPVDATTGYNTFVPFPDGLGGYYLEATWELVILEATGIYRAFAGGHNHMVNRLHQLANGDYDEFCFCNISQYQFP